MDFFTRMLSSMFQSSAARFKNRAVAQVRQNTIGKVQAKTMTKMASLDKAAYQASDRVTGLDRKNRQNKSANELQQNRQMASRGGAGGASGGGQAMGQQQQEPAKMGKGKRNKNQRAMSITCMNCGSDLNPDWDICPYCGTPVGQVGNAGPAAPSPQMPTGLPMPNDNNAEKTMALNMEDLNMNKQRTVVGWIVAQNGNHRGEDFRIYDGKNILGTAADCDIVITDPFLSAKHCTIRHENGNFQVTDLDSMNGTFVNQKRCTKSDLIDNDTIRLGRTEFKFKSLF